MNPVRKLLALFLLLPLAGAAQEIGTLTLVEGGPRLIRGVGVLRGAEGVRLRQGDIIETSSPGFVQLELAGGTIVALGSSTRLFLTRGAGGAELVVLSGWLKEETSSNAGAYGCSSPLLAAKSRVGTIVLHASADVTEIYLESGSADVGEVGAEGNWRNSSNDVQAGQFFSRRAGQSLTVNSRPSSAFVDAMPPPFRDTLPSRLSRFASKPVQPKRDHDVTFSEIQPWLSIGRSWRKGFVDRFEPRLKDPAFREALEVHLNDYPEWDPILHPEKYEPKAPSTADSQHERPSK